MCLAVHTVDEAAAILRVKPSWLERQAAARKIPFTMLGGSYRFTNEHLAAIVALHEKGPGAVKAGAAKNGPRKAPARPRPDDLQAMPLRARPATGPRRAA
jgi:excisionase family DNA binding protein